MQDSTLNLILRSWSWQPTILLGLGLLAAGYIYAYYNLHKQGLLQEDSIKPRQPWYFAAGWATLFIALLSPIDTLSGTLFTMHMTQHVLLIMVAAPLILMGSGSPEFQAKKYPGFTYPSLCCFCPLQCDTRRVALAGTL